MKYQGIKKLYKYKKIDKAFLDAIRANRIYSPIIKQLNDPFESSIYLDEGALNTKYYKELYEVISKIDNIEIKNKTYDSLNRIFFNKNININDIDMSKSSKEKIFRKLATKVGIVSFSSENDSLLLWSHYADSHKGVCLEFNRDSSNDLGDDKMCFPIQYSSFIKDIDINIDINNIYKEIFRYKCDIWDYEKEWRLLTPKGKMLIPFPSKIENVFFGLETEYEDINSIIEILGNGKKYWKAEKVDNQYKIKFKKMEE